MASGVKTIGIIGCGLGGLIAARTLISKGFKVSIMEKSRGPGGRLASKRSPCGPIDIGAQYFTCSEPIFQEQVEKWISSGLVKEWDMNPGVIDTPGQIVFKTNGQPKRYVGCPKMSEIGRAIEKEIPGTISYETLITEAKKQDGKWILSTQDTVVGEYDILIVNTPPKQALPFLNEYPEIQESVEKIKLFPCWAVSLSLGPGSIPVPFDGAFINTGILSWVARNNSKPGRNEGAETWVLHATIPWSEEHLEDSSQSVASELSDEFFRILDSRKFKILDCITHRWRYSIAKNPLQSPGFLISQDSSLGICGDWCNNGKVEGAFMSGYLLAHHLINNYKDTASL